MIIHNRVLWCCVNKYIIPDPYFSLFCPPPPSPQPPICKMHQFIIPFVLTQPMMPISFFLPFLHRVRTIEPSFSSFGTDSRPASRSPPCQCPSVPLRHCSVGQTNCPLGAIRTSCDARMWFLPFFYAFLSSPFFSRTWNRVLLLF